MSIHNATHRGIFKSGCTHLTLNSFTGSAQPLCNLLVFMWQQRLHRMNSGRNFVATGVVGVQAEQSQSVSQDAVATAAKEVKEMDPDYMPPPDIATALR